MVLRLTTRFNLISIALIALILSSCYKDDVIIESLNYNPFDVDYFGTDLFEIDSVYTETNVIMQDTFYTHHLLFTFNEDSLIDPNETYNVSVVDKCRNKEQILTNSDGSNTFEYLNYDVELSKEYCYDFALNKNLTSGKKFNFCYTVVK